jgi:hypothetical protein
VVVWGPKPVALASSASETIAADSTLRKIVVRLIASVQSSDRDPSRLQCSVARTAAASGPNGRSPAGLDAPGAPSACGAVTGSGKDAPEDSEVDPRLRVLLLIVLTATVFGSLEAIREGRGRWSAVLVTVGLAVSVPPILLRVLPPLHRNAQTRQRHPQYWISMLGLVVYGVIVLLIVAHP